MQQSTILGGAIEKKSIVSESIPTYFLEVGMLGSSLRLIRKLYGETAKELANQLGISATYLSEIENGKKSLVRPYSKIRNSLQHKMFYNSFL